MEINKFRSIYSPVFTDAWNFFKIYGQNAPDPADEAAWRKISDEVDALAEKHKECNELNKQILLACIDELERLSKIKGGKT